MALPLLPALKPTSPSALCPSPPSAELASPSKREHASGCWHTHREAKHAVPTPAAVSSPAELGIAGCAGEASVKRDGSKTFPPS